MLRCKKRLIFCICCLLVLLCGFIICSAQSEISRIACCVYGSNGRGFSWFTQDPCGSDLELIKADSFSESFVEAQRYSGTSFRYRTRWGHHVAVTNLEPGAVYYYRVGDRARGSWSEPCSFSTDDCDPSFCFVAIADVQASNEEAFSKSAKTLRAALDLFPNAEFTVNLGDYVNDNTNEEWDCYFSSFAFANNRMTHVPVAGNHDGNITNKFNTNCFQSMFCLDESANRSLEGVYYSFDWGNAHFAVLNTNDMYPMSRAQRNWLENDMANSDAVWKILLMHRALYSAGKNINKPDTIAMRNKLLPLIDKLQIDLVLAGHDHMYLRTAPVRGDKSVPVDSVSQPYGDETFRFAKDPAGTVFALPSTAGTKRYAVNERAMPPILEVADAAFSTKELGGCFASVAIDGAQLVYRAYAVNDETQEATEIDRYAILKTTRGARKESALDQSVVSSIVSYPFDLISALANMLISYFKLLFSLI